MAQAALSSLGRSSGLRTSGPEGWCGAGALVLGVPSRAWEATGAQQNAPPPKIVEVPTQPQPLAAGGQVSSLPSHVGSFAEAASHTLLPASVSILGEPTSTCFPPRAPFLLADGQEMGLTPVPQDTDPCACALPLRPSGVGRVVAGKGSCCPRCPPTPCGLRCRSALARHPPGSVLSPAGPRAPHGVSTGGWGGGAQDKCVSGSALGQFRPLETPEYPCREM